jgi:hypothetical protein
MLPPTFLANPPASAESIEGLRQRLPQGVPADYFELLAIANGGEGFVGSTYVVLYAAEQLLAFNASYHVSEFTPGFLLFGSNAIGDAFAFDVRSDDSRLVLLPFIPLRPDLAEPLGATISEFLHGLLVDPPDPPLTPNPAAIGKEAHDIKPIAFGGDPNDHKNKALVPREQHAELVVFWNQTYQRLAP